MSKTETAGVVTTEKVSAGEIAKVARASKYDAILEQASSLKKGELLKVTGSKSLGNTLYQAIKKAGLPLQVHRSEGNVYLGPKAEKTKK